MHEYSTDAIAHGLLGRKREEIARKAFETALDARGAEGRQPGKIVTDAALQGEKDGHLLIFRRGVT
jgi:hypothetical protein